MGVPAEVTSRGQIAVCLAAVLVMPIFLPGYYSGISHTRSFLELSGNSLDSQSPAIASDDASLLNFSSYLGGSGDEESMSVDCDGAGNIYVAGTTMSRDFPLVNPLDGSFGGRFSEGFITKINPAGEIVYSSYIGGSMSDEICDIFVDNAGFAYLTGFTGSDDFPIINAADSTLDGGDVFVCKINPAGTAFVYSTFIGGSSGECGRAIWVSEQGEAYIAGESYSDDFPTRNAYDATFNGVEDCFVSKLSQGGNVLLYSTLIGGEDLEWPSGISVDDEGAIYVTGTTCSSDFPSLHAIDSTMSGEYDVFVLKLNPSGTTLNYSTFLGGNDVEEGRAIGVDSIGRVYVTGHTTSTNFPTARSLQSSYSGNVDGFLTVFNPDGRSLKFSTYFGNSGAEWPTDLVVNGVGSVYVCGSSNYLYPMILNSYDSIFNGGADAFVFRLDIDNRVVLIGSYLGGSLLDEATSMAVSNDCTMYVCGWTWSNDFPIRNPVDSTYNPGGEYGYDIFVSAIGDSSDWDFDGIPDFEEMQLGTDIFNPDTDIDLLGDYLEVYWLGTNPLTNCTYENGTLDGNLDHDGDTLTNVEELYEYSTDLLNWDSDGDLLSDGFEVHVVGSLPTEFDSDSDSLSDWNEYEVYNTDCLSPDSDQDMMTDNYEVNNGLNPLSNDADGDLDGDLLTNLQEYLIGSSANTTDSDLDNMPDNWEVGYGFNPLMDDSEDDPDYDTLTNHDEFIYGTNPLASDSDSDQLSDSYEVLTLGTDPLSADSDMDSIPDAWEISHGLDPLHDDSMSDLDADGLSNKEEYEMGTRPDMSDTDSDSFSDAWEVRNGFNPTDSHLPLIQTLCYNLPLISALSAVSIALPAIYVIGQQKNKREEQERQRLLSMEIKELLDQISDSLDSAG